MITTTHSNRVSPEVLRRRRATVAASLLVLVTVVAATSGAALTARLFDVGAAMAAVACGVALVHELRRPTLDRAVTPARVRVAHVRRAPGATALADVA